MNRRYGVQVHWDHGGSPMACIEASYDLRLPRHVAAEAACSANRAFTSIQKGTAVEAFLDGR
jgi:hypothetical protein